MKTVKEKDSVYLSSHIPYLHMFVLNIVDEYEWKQSTVSISPAQSNAIFLVLY